MDVAARLAVMAVLVCTMGQHHPTINAEFRYEVLPPVYNSGRPPPTPVFHPPYRPAQTTASPPTPSLEPRPTPYVLPATHTTHPLPPTRQPANPPSIKSPPVSTLPPVIRRPAHIYRPSGSPKDKNALKSKTTSAHKPPAPPVLGDDAALAHNEDPESYFFKYLVEDDAGSFSHSESHDGEEASGTFHLRLPKTHQTFTYVVG